MFINYFGALIRKYTPITEIKILGSQAAKNGVITPDKAKTLENSINRIYENVIAIPIPRWSPIPPLTFLLDNAAPMRVRIIIAPGDAIRLCFSILYGRVLSAPFISRFFI